MLTAEKVIHMLVEIETGKPPSLVTPEANALRAKLIVEVAEIKARGGAVAIPYEVPG